MGKQTRSRKPEVIGKGKVTPVQIAFIVDRYLSDNGFAQARSVFRSEASNLIAKSPVQEAPKTLLSLGAILDEYITLKEQKVALDQERCRLDQEKLRVQNLLSGMQDAMNAYNSGVNNAVTVTPPPPSLLPPAVPPGSAVSQSDHAVTTSAGYYSVQTTPATASTSKPSSSQKYSAAYSTPVMFNTITKRRGSKDVSDGQVNPKRSRRNIQSKDANLVGQTSNAGKNQDRSLANSAVQSSACGNGGSQVQGSNVVKCLFNQENDPASPPANSSVPKTPPLASSSQTEKANSPLDCSTATSNNGNNGIPQQILSANCTIISSETIRVSPTKQIAYYTIEKNSISACSPLKKCSPVKRTNIKDHVKGRLDFGTSETQVLAENQTPDFNTSESEKETDFLDLDFSNLDAFGLDFNFSEFLDTFDIGTGGMSFSSDQALVSSPDSNSGPPSTTENMGQISSSMTGVFGDKDTNLDGTECVEAMRSVTTCIRIVSPAKTRRSNLNQ